MRDSFSIDESGKSEQKTSEEAYGIVTTGVEPIEIAGTGSKIIGYIAASEREKVRLGTYVIVPYENENLFGKFTKLQYRQEFTVDDATEIHSNRMLSNKRGTSNRKVNEEDYKLLASIEPICILYEKNKKDGLQRRMADRIPKPNTPIMPVFDKEMVQTGLNIPKEGIFLGHLSVGGELVRTHSAPPTVAYYMRNDYSSGDPLIFRHMLVCGSTGTGKTFLTKNILRQFETENSRYRQRSDHGILNMPCLVIMDPQDE
ncbi:MAG: ATPase, partial [Methanosarcinales archaeon]|nr:ATPase [Methanosarcinales archaeon]